MALLGLLTSVNFLLQSLDVSALVLPTVAASYVRPDTPFHGEWIKDL
jgi:hypothetical protein